MNPVETKRSHACLLKESILILKKIEQVETSSCFQTKALTELTPMKFNNGFAPDMRKIAWTKPRIAPITNADEADGICLLSFSILDTSKMLIRDFDLDAPSPGSYRT